MLKKNILLIDSEGGHGGSSKSLLTLIKHVNKKNLHLKVLCKRVSWIKTDYKKIGIKCSVVPYLPTYTVLDSIGKNFFAIILFAFSKIIVFLVKQNTFKKHFRNFDLVHLNHSNLWFLALWIRFKFPKLKIIVHIRTMPYKNFFSKLQYKILLKYTDKQIFITKNEYFHFKDLAGVFPDNIIINNPVEKNKTVADKYSFLKKNKKFLIGSFSNYSYYRGTDRVFEVASYIPKKILKNIKFIIAGDINISKGAKKKLKQLKKFNNLKEYAYKSKLEDFFYFAGHINDVENILIHIDLTLKLTREYNPWGRDIIESMLYSVPALSIGKCDLFIKNNYSGILLQKYDAKKVANEIIYLYKNKNILSKLKKNSKKIVIDKCNPKISSSRVRNVWFQL